MNGSSNAIRQGGYTQTVKRTEDNQKNGVVSRVIERHNPHKEPAPLAACRTGNLAWLKSELSKNSFIPFTDYKSGITGNKVSLLTMAALEGHSKVVSTLIDDYGAKVNARNKYGSIPLMSAAMKGHGEVVSILIDRGAYVKASNKRGTTALMSAAQNGHEEVVRILIKYGADVNESTSKKKRSALTLPFFKEKLVQTPLTFAVSPKPHWGVVSILIEHGACAKVSGENGQTPLHFAAREGKSKMVSTLIAAGGDVNASNKYGNTPLISATWKKRWEVVSILIENGADVKAHDNHYLTTALHFVAGAGTLEMASTLIARGDKIDASCSHGHTPLHYAAGMGHSKMVSFLIDSGAGLEALNKRGETPLFRAAQFGNEGVVSTLIGRGACVDARRRDGATSLYVAAENGHRSVVRVLLDAHANPREKWYSLYPIFSRSPRDAARNIAKNKNIEEMITSAIRERKREKFAEVNSFHLNAVAHGWQPVESIKKRFGLSST